MCQSENNQDNNKIGRPSDYTQSLADEICERICLGESVRHISESENMPDRVTIYRWLLKNEAFRNQYARAKEDQADFHAEELLDIADDAKNDWMEIETKKGVKIVFDKEHVARSHLRVEARKWLMGKMRPKKYGDAVLQKLADADGNKIDIPCKLEVVIKGE
jgi:hypothetical protein